MSSAQGAPEAPPRFVAHDDDDERGTMHGSDSGGDDDDIDVAELEDAIEALEMGGDL